MSSDPELSAIEWREPSPWFSRFWLPGSVTRSLARSKTAMASKCVESMMQLLTHVITLHPQFPVKGRVQKWGMHENPSAY